MEKMEMIIKYAGAPVNVLIHPEEHLMGTLYPVEMNGNYCFTICMNEDENWEIMREPDGEIPYVDSSLLSEILRILKLQLRYAA